VQRLTSTEFIFSDA